MTSTPDLFVWDPQRDMNVKWNYPSNIKSCITLSVVHTSMPNLFELSLTTTHYSSDSRFFLSLFYSPFAQKSYLRMSNREQRSWKLSKKVCLLTSQHNSFNNCYMYVFTSMVVVKWIFLRNLFISVTYMHKTKLFLSSAQFTCHSLSSFFEVIK